MSGFKITLKDGTQYDLADGAFSSKFTIVCSDRADFNAVWDSLTDENLEEVIVSAGTEEITRIRYLILDGAQAMFGMNGTVTGNFYFHGAEYSHSDAMNPEDLEYAQAGRILLGEEE